MNDYIRFRAFHVFWILSEKVDSYVCKDFQKFVYIVNILNLYTYHDFSRDASTLHPYVPAERLLVRSEK